MGSGDSWLVRFMFYFGFVMAAIYIGLGIILLFIPVFLYIPKNIRIVFGLFFLMYGLFRLVRITQKSKKSDI